MKKYYAAKYSDGSYEKIYYKEGEYHREDGPAYIRKYADGTYEKRYYINNKEIEMPENLTKEQIKIYLRSSANI
jgi:hypothetical protein